MATDQAPDGPRHSGPSVSGTRSSYRLPDFVIIGAMRSGTTSLSRYLGAHPEVFVPQVKECHYFDRGHLRGTAWYAAFFEEAGEEQLAGEATPNYLYDPAVPGRMWRELPDARLIAVLRNPVDRAYSHYWHRRARNDETLSFEAALDAEPERLASDDPATRAHHSYVSRGLYVDQLERFLALYPRHSLMTLTFEHLRDDPVGSYGQVCAFLGIDAESVPDIVGQRLNPHVEFRALALRNLAKRAPRLIARVLGRLNTTSVDYPPMDPATRRRLLDRFAEPNARLATLTGLDLSAWST